MKQNNEIKKIKLLYLPIPNKRIMIIIIHNINYHIFYNYKQNKIRNNNITNCIYLIMNTFFIFNIILKIFFINSTWNQ